MTDSVGHHENSRKDQLVQQLIQQLLEEREQLLRAATAAREAATHEESKPEDQYDTRGLEASYLAGAQAARAAEIDRAITMFRGLTLRTWKDQEPVSAGALVELEQRGRRTHYFIVPLGGGLTVSLGALRVQTVTPQSPLGDELLGKRIGDSVEVESQGMVREYSVVSIL